MSFLRGLSESARLPLYATEDFQPQSWDFMEENPDYLPDPREAPPRKMAKGKNVFHFFTLGNKNLVEKHTCW